MITEIIKLNRVVFISLFLLLQGCDMFDEPKEQPFEVFGEPSLLKDMVINIESQIDENNHIYHKSKVQTVLYKGKTYKFTNNNITQYTIYINYGNKVSSVEFENIVINKKHVNYIHVFKENNELFLRYYFSDEKELQDGYHPQTPLLVSIDEYFINNKIVEKDEQQEMTKKFYDFYNPEDQQFKTVPFTKEGIKRLEMLPINEKLMFYFRPEDLQKMDLPKDELKILIDHYNFGPNNPDKEK